MPFPEIDSLEDLSTERTLHLVGQLGHAYLSHGNAMSRHTDPKYRMPAVAWGTLDQLLARFDPAQQGGDAIAGALIDQEIPPPPSRPCCRDDKPGSGTGRGKSEAL